MPVLRVFNTSRADSCGIFFIYYSFGIEFLSIFMYYHQKIKDTEMFRQILITAVLFLMLACKPVRNGFDSTAYDLYKESQFANGFTLIKDNYSKMLNSEHEGEADDEEVSSSEGIMRASLMFGRADLLNIKKQIIAQMDNPEAGDGENGIWAPLFAGVEDVEDGNIEWIDAWVYWFLFAPQIDYSAVGADENRDLSGMAVMTAVSRADLPYWREKVVKCVKSKLSAGELEVIGPVWLDVTKECQADYLDKISKMSAEIYAQLKALPQYQTQE